MELLRYKAAIYQASAYNTFYIIWSAILRELL